MADTIILKVALQDAEAVIAGLQNIDALAARLRAPINIPLGVGGAGASGGSGGSVSNATKQVSGLGLALKALPLKLTYDAVRVLKREVKEALSTMKSVDSELATIQKVTGMSNGELKELSNTAYSLATAYGRTADEVLNASTVFARAGYQRNITELSELSILLQNVGDLESDQASKFLVATDAAYHLNGEYSSLIKVVDGLNEITNHHATDMQVMTDGMTVAGSVFAESGESIETFAAMLGTASAATQRSGAEVGRGLRTVLMNIRQIRGETEDGELIDGESIANAAKALKEYADISTMENGNLRLASDVLDELAGKWENLSSVAQSAIAEALAGKRQSNILTALLSDWDSVGTMVQEYTNAAGSALEENRYYLESWEARAKAANSAWTELVANIVETDAIKGALDLISGGLEAINSEFDTALEKQEKTASESSTYRREAEQSAKALAEQYEADFGANSRYQQLKDSVLELTSAEQTELAVLEARKKAREEELGIAVATLETAKEAEKTAIDNRGSVKLDGLQSSIQGISTVFESTHDVSLYNSQIQEVIQSYADYVEKLRAAKDAGEELGESELRMIDTFDVVARASLNSGNAIEQYGNLVGAYVYAETGDWNAAATAANTAMAELSAAVKAVPEGKTVSVETDGADEAIGKLSAINSLAGSVTKSVKVVSSGGFTKPGHASGTTSAPGGPSLVNELGPELISANGLAWIAGGGQPTVTNLPHGAVVLTAQQTKRALNGTGGRYTLPAYADGITPGSAFSIGTWIAGLIQDYRDNRAAQRAAAAAEVGTEYSPIKASTLMGKNNRQTSEQARQIAQYEYTDTAEGPLQMRVGGPVAAGGAGRYSSEDGGGGTGGRSGTGGGASAVDLKQAQKDLDDELKNLKAHAKLADNRGQHRLEGDIYGTAQDRIKEMLAEYRAQGYSDTSDEVLKLENLLFDYAEDQEKAYQHVWDEMEDALDGALKTINAKIEKAENENDIPGKMALYAEAQDKIADLIDEYLAAGYAPDSDEVLRLTNLGYDYAGKHTGLRDSLYKDLISAIEGLKNSTDEANDLAEKQQAVEDARQAYESASRQRTVRIFNPVTGQWEWVANARDVQAAQERLQSAEKTLRDTEWQRAISAAKSDESALSGLIAGAPLAAAYDEANVTARGAFLQAMGAYTGGASYAGSAEAARFSNHDSHDVNNYYSYEGIRITPDNPAYLTMQKLAQQLSVLNIM